MLRLDVKINCWHVVPESIQNGSICLLSDIIQLNFLKQFDFRYDTISDGVRISVIPVDLRRIFHLSSF